MRRDIVCQRIAEAVNAEFGSSGGAGAEEHDHRIIACRRIFRTPELCSEAFRLDIIAVPAGTDPVYDDPEHPALFACRLRRLFHPVRGLSVRRADHSHDAGFPDPVDVVFRHELVICRHGDRPELMKSEKHRPELDVPL